MESPRVKEVIGVGTWEEKAPGLWICHPFSDSDFYFSIEGWHVNGLGAAHT
jgi:hypothetical protein